MPLDGVDVWDATPADPSRGSPSAEPRAPRELAKDSLGRFALHRRQVGEFGHVCAQMTTTTCPASRPRDLNQSRRSSGEELHRAWDVHLVTNRLLRAYRFTGAAVNAFVWVDVHHPVALVDAIYGTFLNARLVQYIHATLGNHVSQGSPPPVTSVQEQKSVPRAGSWYRQIYDTCICRRNLSDHGGRVP